jgi:hypothetical protein
MKYCILFAALALGTAAYAGDPKTGQADGFGSSCCTSNNEFNGLGGTITGSVINHTVQPNNTGGSVAVGSYGNQSCSNDCPAFISMSGAYSAAKAYAKKTGGTVVPFTGLGHGAGYSVVVPGKQRSDFVSAVGNDGTGQKASTANGFKSNSAGATKRNNARQCAAAGTC